MVNIIGLVSKKFLHSLLILTLILLFSIPNCEQVWKQYRKLAYASNTWKVYGKILTFVPMKLYWSKIQ